MHNMHINMSRNIYTFSKKAVSRLPGPVENALLNQAYFAEAV